MSVKEFLDNQKPVIIGLSWETGKKEVDLDLQCVILNEIGQILEAVYFNNPTSKTKAILYSGDSKGQGTGFDEMSTINLKLLPSTAKYVVVLTCCNTGKPMAAQNGSILIQQGEKKIVNQSLKEQGKHLSLLSAVLQKDFAGQWYCHTLKEVGEGKVFLENEALIKKGIVKAGFDENLHAQCNSWTGDKSFRLDKENPLVIPPQIHKLHLGLGWKTTCDIDCSVITFNSNNQMVEQIYFGNKKSQDGSIIHQGDNLTGQGAEKTDDEVIEIDLSKVKPEVETIWTVITIFTDGKQFDDVRSAYCRLVDETSHKEFCRFQLSKNKDGVSNGSIMSCITRQNQNTWSIVGKGFYTKGTKSSSLVSPIIRNILNNDYSKVTFRDLIQEAKAQWQLNVLRAENLGSFDVGGKSDPYVKVKLNGHKIGKTATVMLNLNPVFNYPVQLNLNVGDKLEFKIYDYDRFSKDDYMGSCFMTIEQSHFDEAVKDFQLKVKNSNGNDEDKYKGNLFIQLKELW